MKLELNNLAALVQGIEMNLYQRNLAIAEFQSVIELLHKLESEEKANGADASTEPALPIQSVIGRYVSELEIEYKHPSGKCKGRLMYEDNDSDYLILKCNGSFISLPELDKCKVINAL